MPLWLAILAICGGEFGFGDGEGVGLGEAVGVGDGVGVGEGEGGVGGVVGFAVGEGVAGAVVAVTVGAAVGVGIGVGAVAWAGAIDGGAAVGATVGAALRAGLDTITSSGSGVGVVVERGSVVLPVIASETDSATGIFGSSTGAVVSAPCAAPHTPSTSANPEAAKRPPSAPETFKAGVSAMCEWESYLPGRIANVLTITRHARSRARTRRVAGFI